MIPGIGIPTFVIVVNNILDENGCVILLTGPG